MHHKYVLVNKYNHNKEYLTQNQLEKKVYSALKRISC